MMINQFSAPMTAARPARPAQAPRFQGEFSAGDDIIKEVIAELRANPERLETLKADVVSRQAFLDKVSGMYGGYQLFKAAYGLMDATGKDLLWGTLQDKLQAASPVVKAGEDPLEGVENTDVWPMFVEVMQTPDKRKTWLTRHLESHPDWLNILHLLFQRLPQPLQSGLLDTLKSILTE
jgi:hypothetical protein